MSFLVLGLAVQCGGTNRNQGALTYISQMLEKLKAIVSKVKCFWKFSPNFLKNKMFSSLPKEISVLLRPCSVQRNCSWENFCCIFVSFTFHCNSEPLFERYIFSRMNAYCNEKVICWPFDFTISLNNDPWSSK